MTEQALREDRGPIAVVTLNRPEKLNAMTPEMLDVIDRAIQDLRDRDELRVLLIRARGRYFTAGIDIRAKNEADKDEEPKDLHATRRDYRRPLHVRLDEMESVEKPVVMAIHAPCLGVGVEMAGSVDFRLAAESATFALPEMNIGVVAGSGGISRFTRLCGIGWSKWLSVAGETIDAHTARTAGFVQAVWPDAEFEEHVWAFCERLASKPLEVQTVSKLAVDLAYDLDRTGARHMERIVNAPLQMRDNSELVEQVLGKSKSKGGS